MRMNEKRILAQKPPFTRHKLHWLVAISTVPLFGVVAAFGIAPDTVTDRISIQQVVENLPLPSAMPSAETEEFWSEERVQPGDTAANLLARLNVSDSNALRYLRTSSETRSLLRLSPGKRIQARTNADGELLSLEYINDSGRLQVVEKAGGGFKTQERILRAEPRLVMRSGEIKSSLFAATDAAGLPDSVASQLSDIFSSDLDFHRDLQRGDKFAVVFETFDHDGEVVQVGRLLAAEFVSGNRSYRAVYFDEGNGRRGYYTPEGRSLRKAFLRSPLEFSRITSGFTPARFHPVLQNWRAHKGVDYGAPIGTRVRATADGVVAFVGSQRGYGNVIILQHHDAYSTVYGHLSGFAGGLYAGQKVSQGDVIGFVGMTGLTSGPHLHYEFLINGEQQDPLSVAVPTHVPMSPQAKATFDAVAKPLAQRLNLLRNTNLARLD